MTGFEPSAESMAAWSGASDHGSDLNDVKLHMDGGRRGKLRASKAPYASWDVRHLWALSCVHDSPVGVSSYSSSPVSFGVQATHCERLSDFLAGRSW